MKIVITYVFVSCRICPRDVGHLIEPPSRFCDSVPQLHSVFNKLCVQNVIFNVKFTNMSILQLIATFIEIINVVVDNVV